MTTYFWETMSMCDFRSNILITIMLSILNTLSSSAPNPLLVGFMPQAIHPFRVGGATMNKLYSLYDVHFRPPQPLDGWVSWVIIPTRQGILGQKWLPHLKWTTLWLLKHFTWNHILILFLKRSPSTYGTWKRSRIMMVS
jgi:hypothetical protein